MANKSNNLNERPAYDFRLLSTFGVFSWAAIGALILFLIWRLVRDFTMAGPDSIDIFVDSILTVCWLLSMFSILRQEVAFYDSRIEVTTGLARTREYSYSQLDDVQSAGANYADALVFIFNDKKKYSLSKKMRGEIEPATIADFLNEKCGREVLNVHNLTRTIT